MAVLLKELYSSISSQNIRLVAGDKGLTNIVSWTHVVENEKIADFLLGEEIIFTTGLGLSDKLTLLDLVKLLHQKKASGVMVNVGPYIPQIPQAVLDFADAHSLPIFSVPWHIHMAELNRTFCFYISDHQRKTENVEMLFKNALFFGENRDDYVQQLALQGFAPTAQYVVGVLHTSNIGMEPARLLSTFRQYFTYRAERLVSFVHNRKIVLIFCGLPLDSTLILHGFFHFVTQSLQAGERIALSCGSTVGQLDFLAKSYQQAIKTDEIIDNLVEDEQKILLYQNLGIYKILMSTTDTEAVQEFVQDTVKPLFDYDLAHDYDLVHVLKTYLENNASVQKTAEILFIHRNTVNYKIKKAEEVLRVDLSDMHVRTNLIIGFMAAQIVLQHK